MTDTLEAPVMIERNGVVAPNPADPSRVDAFLPSPCVQNHAANLMELPDGAMGCVWFGGTQEGVPDISAYFSRLDPQTDV